MFSAKSNSFFLQKCPQGKADIQRYVKDGKEDEREDGVTHKNEDIWIIFFPNYMYFRVQSQTFSTMRLPRNIPQTTFVCDSKKLNKSQKVNFIFIDMSSKRCAASKYDKVLHLCGTPSHLPCLPCRVWSILLSHHAKYLQQTCKLFAETSFACNYFVFSLQVGFQLKTLHLCN